jgi:Rrf2 family protein
MKALSMASVYGLRALIYIAAKKDGAGFVRAREMSAELGISSPFLAKILQSLTHAGILTSTRGPHGGVMLTRPAEDVTVLDIITVLEGPDYFNHCLLGLPGCGEAEPCPVHDFWKTTKATLREEFSSTSLAGLAAKVNTHRFRLSADQFS